MGHAFGRNLIPNVLRLNLSSPVVVTVQAIFYLPICVVRFYLYNLCFDVINFSLLIFPKY